MSIFGTIKDAIFGSSTPAPSPASAPAATPQPAAPPPPAPAPTKLSEDEIYAVLEKHAQARGEQLNYKTSIVDLMKAIGQDSSLDARKQLAGELGYTGDTNDSATMNIWLHQKTMEKLMNG
jgi:3-oxoacyl-ACP reductase-like protein